MIQAVSLPKVTSMPDLPPFDLQPTHRKDFPALPSGGAILRPATIDDVPALVQLEERCFDTDRLSRRSFLHLLRRGNASCLVATENGSVVGYSLLLFNAGTSLARLYSFAVDPDHRGKGIAKRLLSSTEQEAVQHDSAYVRLEVRRDNIPAITLYKAVGYREFGTYPDYYEDHMEALRLEKRLLTSWGPPPNADRRHIPFYEQTTDFTCGPAALMMAMKGLDPAVDLDRKLELRIWRESTTIFMTSGHGGCSPFGLAISAWRRGFDTEITVNDDQPLFLDSVRSEEKKKVIRLVHEDQLDEAIRLGIPVHYHAFSAGDLTRSLDAGALPVVLISSYSIYREKFPHWVVVTGADDRFFYVHDPLVEYDKHQSSTDRMNMPIAKRDFERMARYGKAQLKATVTLRSRRKS